MRSHGLEGCLRWIGGRWPRTYRLGEADEVVGGAVHEAGTMDEEERERVGKKMEEKKRIKKKKKKEIL